MRAMGSWWCGAAVALLVLGCASEQGIAQEEGGKKEKPTKAATKPTTKNKGGKKDAEKKDTNTYRAKIRDRWHKAKDKPFQITKVLLFTPEVSLFGGSSGTESKVLEVRIGKSATVQVPFHRIAKLHVGKTKEDRLEVKLELRKTKKAGREVKGTVKASLELRGFFLSNNLKTTVKLRETTLVELEVVPKKKKKK